MLDTLGFQFGLAHHLGLVGYDHLLYVLGVVGIGGPDYDGMVVALGQEDADDWLSGTEMRAIISEQG